MFVKAGKSILTLIFHLPFCLKLSVKFNNNPSPFCDEITLSISLVAPFDKVKGLLALSRPVVSMAEVGQLRFAQWASAAILDGSRRNTTMTDMLSVDL